VAPSPLLRAGLLGALALAVAGIGVLAHLSGEVHRLHDPNAGMRQLDLLFLDEPAPLLDRICGPPAAGVLVLFVCDGCSAPSLRDDAVAEVRVTGDREVARAYALQVADRDRVGPGYALITADGRVRYRTFDPSVSGNAEEIRILVRSLPGGRGPT
jgi:hypothetical protein